MTTSTLETRARAAAAKAIGCKPDCQDEDCVTEFAAEIVRIAREHARDVLRSIYEVDDNDQWSSDGERARGGYRVRYEYAGTGNIEKRHYREEFNQMIREALQAAEQGGEET